MKKMIEGPSAQRIREALDGKQLSFKEVAARCYLSEHAARRNLHALHVVGDVHVGAWVRRMASGPWVPMYVAGRGRDAAKPKPINGAARMRRFRDNNPDYVLDEIVAKRKARAAGFSEKSELVHVST